MDVKQIEHNIKCSKRLRQMAATQNKYAAIMALLAVLGYYGAAVTLKDEAYLPFAIFIATGVTSNIRVINALAKSHRYNKQANEYLLNNSKTK